MIRKEEILETAQSSSFPQEGEALMGIETTGLSWRRSFVCMAFAAYRPQTGAGDGASGNTLICRCFMCESRREEGELLQALRDALAPFCRIWTYGGSIFSWRFIRERYILTSDDPFLQEGQRACDIYDSLRPLRSLLPVNNLKKMTAEKLAGFVREDLLSGRDMTALYEEWENDRSDQMADRLLGHLKEDALSLCSLGRLLALPRLFDGSLILSEKAALSGEEAVISLLLAQDLPFPLSASSPLGRLTGQGRHARICLCTAAGRMKHFLPGPYQEYWYLPAEDLTVHRSIARTVARSRREKATARTCFLAAEGIFLPSPSPSPLPLWKKTYEDKDNWILYAPGEWEKDPGLLRAWILALLGTFL